MTSENACALQSREKLYYSKQNIFTIVRFFNSVSTCISERVFSHLEGVCSDCKQKKGSHLTSC